MTKTERINLLEQQVLELSKTINILLTRVADIDRNLQEVNNGINRFRPIGPTTWPAYNPNITPVGDWPFGPTVTC